MRKVFTGVFLFFLLFGCGGQKQQLSGDGGKRPTVEQAEHQNGNADIAKYTNADWLYQNYFGEYGLPDEFKPMVADELKMVANGFAYQISKGEDVKASITQLNRAMQMLHLSGQFSTGLQGMMNDYSSGKTWFHPKSNNRRARNAGGDAVVPFEKEISEEMKIELEQARQEDEAYAREQEQIVIDHNLPYALPDRVTKYITVNQAMKGGKGGGGGGNGGGGNIGDDDEDWGSYLSHNVETWRWDHADIIWSNGGYGIGHMGLVDKPWNVMSKDAAIIDANTSAGVSKHFNMKKWASHYSKVAGYFYGWWNPLAEERYDVMLYANAKVGQQYNWAFWDKGNDNRSYCSQLVWKAYYDTHGVDLDSNGGFVVWPDDIISSYDLIKIFSSSRAANRTMALPRALSQKT